MSRHSLAGSPGARLIMELQRCFPRPRGGGLAPQPRFCGAQRCCRDAPLDAPLGRRRHHASARSSSRCSRRPRRPTARPCPPRRPSPRKRATAPRAAPARCLRRLGARAREAESKVCFLAALVGRLRSAALLARGAPSPLEGRAGTRLLPVTRPCRSRAPRRGPCARARARVHVQPPKMEQRPESRGALAARVAEVLVGTRARPARNRRSAARGAALWAGACAASPVWVLFVGVFLQRY